MSPIVDVLLVDDEPDWRTRLKRLVGDEFIIEEAASEEEAFLCIHKRFYHCALLDKSLILDQGTDEGGMRVLGELAKLNEGTKGLILTAFGDTQSTKVALRDWQAVDYIQKQLLGAPDQRKRVQDTIRETIIAGKADYTRRYSSGCIQLTTAVSVTNEPRIVWESDMISIGKSHGYEALSKFLDLLLHEIPPLLPYRPGEPPFIDIEHATAEGRYWSKGLGESVLIKMGRKERIEAEKQSLGSETVIRHVSHESYGGLILKAGLRFEDLPSRA